MKLEIEDLTRHFINPPTLQQMVGGQRDGRRVKKDVLIIVPSYHDSFRLKKLLRYFRGQSFRNFDVAVILAGDDRFVTGKGVCLWQIKRAMDLGFAGSVYLGQLLALQGGYKYYLFTDVDRVPHTKGELGALFAEAERTGADFTYGNNMVKGYFFPSSGFFDYQNPAVIPSNCVFSLIRSSTLEKTGLYALPLYIGYEDVEFEHRLRSAASSTAYIDRVVYESYSSPAKNSFLRNFGGDSLGHMYLYPTMICMFSSPQTAAHLGFFRMLRMYFLVMLSQKFSALRAPALYELEKRARRGQFGKVKGSGVSEDVKVSPYSEKSAEDYKSYTANAFSQNFFQIISEALSPSKKHAISNYSPLFNFFMPDSIVIYDEGKKRAMLFEWRRKTNLLQRLSALLSSLFDATAASLGAYAMRGSMGLFEGYGLPKDAAGERKT